MSKKRQHQIYNSKQIRSFNSHGAFVHDDNTVEAYVTVFGVEIQMHWWTEIVHPGAFFKTINERGL